VNAVRWAEKLPSNDHGENGRLWGEAPLVELIIHF
jgi:hypothetical protein